MSRALRRARLGALVLSLATGCALGPDYKRPGGLTPETYRDQPVEAASIADLPWWDVFRDPTLSALIREALESNLELTVAVARVEQARYRAAVARSPLFPQIGYQAVAARGKQSTLGGVSMGTEEEDSYLAALDLAWEIDIWGRIRRTAEAGRAELVATDAVRRGVVLSLVSAVAQGYFKLLELDRELQIARDSVRAFTETRDLFQRQYEGGVTSRLDPVRGEAALADAAALVPRIEASIVAKENELAVLLGRPAGAIARGAPLEEQPLAPDAPAGVPASLLGRRPDLIQSEQLLVASNALIGATFAGFFPRIGLTALSGSVSDQVSSLLEGDTSLWSVAGDGAGPIFTAGRTTYLWRASQANTDAALAAYEGTVLNALREVSDALTSRTKLAAVRAERERAVAALQQAVNLSRTRYVEGRSSYFEVLDAQQQLYPAEYALAQTRRDELLALVDLYRALGGGWAQEPEAPATPSPLAP